jgi:hypothetical protein
MVLREYLVQDIWSASPIKAHEMKTILLPLPLKKETIIPHG